MDAQSGNPFADIANGNVPLGGLSYDTAWGFVNLLLAVLSVLMALLMFVVLLRRRSTGRLVTPLRFITLVTGVLTGLLFLLLENLTQPMVFINKWTPLMTLLFVAQAVLLVVQQVAKKRSEEHQPEQAEA